jgi:hypothetical protein
MNDEIIAAKIAACRELVGFILAVANIGAGRR